MLFVNTRMLLVCLSWEETTEEKCRSPHIISRVHTVNMTYHCGCWHWSADWSSICRVSLLWDYSFSLHSLLFGKCYYVHLTLKVWVVCSTSLRWSNYVNCLELCMEDLSIFPPCVFLFNHFSQCEFMDICLILQVIIQYYFILWLKLFQFWSFSQDGRHM